MFRINNLMVSLKDIEVVYVEYSDYSKAYMLYIYMRNRKDGFHVKFDTEKEAVKVFNELLSKL